MEEMYEQHKRPGFIEKAGQQCRRHPMIPTGMLATLGALTMALKRMQQRNAVGYQRWLRARVLAQGLTIVAIVVAGVQEMGIGVLTGNPKPVSPPPPTAWESREFEKRLKEAEEAHHEETGFIRPTGQADSTMSPIVQAADAAAPPPQSSTSSWTSWLGPGKK